MLKKKDLNMINQLKFGSRNKFQTILLDDMI